MITSTSEPLSPGSISRDQLPIGVSQMMASRMRLDATMAPALLNLRMNYRNLLNEMQLNNGKVVSHQFALMQPRRKPRFDRLTELDIPEGVNQAMFRKLAKKAERERRKKLKALAEAEEQGWSDSVSLASLQLMGSQPSGPQMSPKKKQSVKDPTLLHDVLELTRDPQVEVVFTTLEEPPNSGRGLQLHRVSRALEALGHRKPDHALIKSSIGMLVNRDPDSKEELELAEFCVVLHNFSKKRQQDLRAQFQALDTDKSGTVNTREFRHLIWNQGYTISPEAVAEIFDEVDSDKSGEIEIAEFEKAAQTVHERHGFTQKEVKELYDVFDRYDDDNSGELSADELASALGWLGHQTSIHDAEELLSRFDDDSSGTLARAEFLVVMRHRLEEDFQSLRTLFSHADSDSSGSLRLAEVEELFQAVGYHLPLATLEEGIAELGNHIDRQKLVFEDVVHLLGNLRKREGFSTYEVQELTGVFNQFNKMSEEGEMREHEVARALTWLGYPVSLKQRRHIWVKVDVDKSGLINQSEFLKFIRFLREMEIEALQEFLEKHKDENVFKEREMKGLLSKLGYAPAQPLFQQSLKMSQDSSGDGHVDLVGLLGVLDFIRQGQVKRLRQSAGLPDHQAAKVISKFGMKTDGGKRITPDEFQKFMQTLFKEARESIDERDRIKKIIQDHCVRGGLDLNAAFWVVRTYADMRDEESWRQEQAVIQEANFTPAQVAKYRETFYEMGGDENNVLTQDQAFMAFNQLVKLSKIQIKILKGEFEDLGDAADRIDFGEFLHLMGVVLGVIQS